MHTGNTNQNHVRPFSPTRMPVIKKTDAIEQGRGVEEVGPSHNVGGTVTRCSCYRKRLAVAQSTKHGVTARAGNSAPRYTPRRTKPYIRSKTCTQTDTVAEN